MSRPSSLWVLVAGLAIGPAAVLRLAAESGVEIRFNDQLASLARSERGRRHTADKNLPVKWTDADLAWKVELPGSGQSSPIIWGEKIFLTAALEKGKERIVFCLDRSDGRLLWKQSAWTGEPEPVHIMNGWASASCVTDGEVVIAFFGRGGIHAYDVDGKKLWSKDLGPFESPGACRPARFWSAASSFRIATPTRTPTSSASTSGPATRCGRPNAAIIAKLEHADRSSTSPDIKRSSSTVTQERKRYDPKTGRELWYCKSFAAAAN